MLTYKQYYYLKEQFILESFKDVLIIWSKSNDKEEVKLYIDKFKSLRSKNQLEGENKDISNWMNKDFNDFKDYVNKKEEEYQEKIPLKKKAVESDSPTIFENDLVFVKYVKNKNASCKLGSDADWCVSKQNHSYWEQYSEDNDMTFYYIERKNKKNDETDKYMINVYSTSHYENLKSMSDEEREEKAREDINYVFYMNDKMACQIWDKKNNNVSDDFSSIIRELKIDEDIFKSIVDENIGHIKVGDKLIKYKLENGVRVFRNIDISNTNISQLPDFATA